MRGLRRAAALGCAVLMLAAPGCTQEPEITDQQVAAWNAEAAELFPALDMKITGGTETTMLGSSNYVHIEVAFNDYSDLTSTETEFAAFLERLKDEGHDDHPSISAYGADGSREEALETTLSKQASQRIEDAVGVEAGLSYHPDPTGDWRRYFFIHIDVVDPSALTLERLESDAEIASDIASQVAPDSVVLSYFNASVLDASGLPEGIGPKSVDALTAVADGDCLHTDRWALELDDFVVRIYAANAPQGACA